MKYKYFLLLIIIMIFVWAGSYFLMTHLFGSPADSEATVGVAGDMFGAINSLFSGLGLAGIIYTIILQREQMSNQKAEYDLERKEHLLDEAAKKIRMLDNMHFELKTMRDFYGANKSSIQMNSSNTYHEIRACLYEADKSKKIIELKQIVDNSVKIDAEIYKALVPLERNLSDIHRRDRHNFVDLEAGEKKIDLVVAEMLATLLSLRNETESVMNVVKQRRLIYIKVVFPDIKDHDLFMLTLT